MQMASLLKSSRAHEMCSGSLLYEFTHMDCRGYSYGLSRCESAPRHVPIDTSTSMVQGIRSVFLKEGLAIAQAG